MADSAGAGQARPRPAGVRAGLAAALLIAGLVLWAAFRVLSGTEHHAFSAGGVPPSRIEVTAGATYELSVRGGAQALADRGEQITSPECEWSSDGSVEQALTVSAEPADTKATNVVASFVAPLTGDIDITCLGWGSIYVDDADNAPGDPAGYLLVLAIIALTIGGGLVLSALRTASERLALERADTATTP